LTDFKQVYDSINGTYLYKILKEFGTPKKLVGRIILMWISGTGMGAWIKLIWLRIGTGVGLL
jgi:hypothetical protein